MTELASKNASLKSGFGSGRSEKLECNAQPKRGEEFLGEFCRTEIRFNEYFCKAIARKGNIFHDAILKRVVCSQQGLVILFGRDC